MNVIGLDLSLTATGCCGYRPDAHGPVCWTIATKKRTGYLRLRAILTDIATAVDTYRPDLVVIEGQSHGSKGSATLDIAELHGVVKFYLAPRLPFVLVAPGTAKVYATGKGIASKDEVLLAVERRYGGLVTVADNNEADALVLAAMALHHDGHPLADVPASHARALTSVTWPDLPAATP